MLAKAAVLACVALLVTSCGGTIGGGTGGGNADSNAPVKVGVITGLTGAYVQLGEQQRNGAELAAEMLGGKAGNRPIQVIVRDDQLKPDIALREAQSLVQEEHVDFLTGCVSAATTLAVNQVAKQAGVPYLGTCQTEQLNRPPNFDAAVTYHLAPATSQPIRAAAPFICGQLGQRIFLLQPDYAFGHEQEVGYAAALPQQPGCGIVGTAFFPLGTTDYTPYIPTIEGSGANVLVFGGAGRDQVSFLRQASQFALAQRLKIFLDLEDLSFDEELGFNLVEGTYAMSAFYWTVNDPGVQEYVKAYQNKYGQPPGGYGVYLYNALKLIASQVAAGKGSPAQFRQALEGQQTTLGQGPMTIRACDHQALTPVYILRGLGANEAASRGGDPKYGLREVVQTIPGTEQYASSCAEVATEFKGSS